MPLYEYGCPACGALTDVRHGFDEKPQLTCERCGAELQRRFSAAPIVFKGSGFYVTDSRSKSAASEKSDKPEKKAEPAEKSETKSAESKSAESKSAESTGSSGEKKPEAAA